MSSSKGAMIRKAGRWLPGVFISIVLLVVVFRVAKWDDLGDAFTYIRWPYILAALALTMASLLTKSAAWRTLLGNAPGYWQTFFIVNEGYFLNNILPFRAGEVGRAIFMGQSSKKGAMHVISTIVIERAFDVAMAASLLLATLPLTLGMAEAKSAAVTTMILVVAGFGALFLMARFNEQVKDLVNRVGGRWPLVQKWIVPRIDSLLEGLKVLTRPSQFFAAVAWSLVTWVFWVGIYYVMLLSIAPNAPLWWGAFVDSFLAMGMAIPSAPAGLGVFEASIVFALSLLKVDAAKALAYAISLHFMQFVTTAIFGLIGLLREGRSISVLFEGMEKKEQPDTIS
ncbi:MAG: flippase-like domain-containing protein [Chloroflexi bacterium]|nr:flippase-like domain-containing protein [Chloroflexota bacterium]